MKKHKKKLINKVGPLLTIKAERELLQNYQNNGCIKSLNTLISKYEGFVVNLINKMNVIKHEQDRGDVFGYANKALVIAANNFNLRKELRFSTYAASVLEHNVRRDMRYFYFPVSVPKNHNPKFKTQEAMALNIINLDNFYKEKEIHENFSKETDERKLEDYKKSLSNNEFKVLKFTTEERNQCEIASILKVSQPRVARLLKKAKEKIKSFGN